MKKITAHHDGHGLNDKLVIKATDNKGPGGAHHRYWIYFEDEEDGGDAAGYLQFQCGPRDEPGSTPGLTSAAVVALLIDHLQEFQDGEFPSRETALAITKLQEALFWMRHRADLRAARGVLGRAEK